MKSLYKRERNEIENCLDVNHFFKMKSFANFGDFRTREKDDACALKKSLSSSVVGLINVSSLVISLQRQLQYCTPWLSDTIMNRRQTRGLGCVGGGVDSAMTINWGKEMMKDYLPAPPLTQLKMIEREVYKVVLLMWIHTQSISKNIFSLGQRFERHYAESMLRIMS